MNRLLRAIWREVTRRHRRCHITTTRAGQCYCLTHRYTWEPGQLPACACMSIGVAA